MRTPGRRLAGSLLPIVAVALAGCWSPPIATVQPKGAPRLIEGAIAVESVEPPAVVQSVDLHAHAITVLGRGEDRPVSYRVSPKVKNLDRLKVGDTIQATVAEELTVYVSANGQGQPPVAGGLPPNVDARVLSVDRSYRLLTLRFPDGRDETFKVGLQVKLDEMEAGDAVSIQPVEAIALRVKGRRSAGGRAG
jgi:hypothetical protein